MIRKTLGENLNNDFLVRIQGKEFIFDKEHFLNFCKKAKRHDWTFSFGDRNSNMALRPSKTITEDELLEMFNLDDIQVLLQYRRAKFGTQWIVEMPFFSKEIYLKYGKEIKWEDEY